MLTPNSQCFGNVCRTLQFYGLCENRLAFTTDLCYCNDFGVAAVVSVLNGLKRKEYNFLNQRSA
jgi:hypothetical protein